ncbi:MAG: aconitase/3-isopropylmalate dehydratase large subunit family protein, partial [bacterium]
MTLTEKILARKSGYDRVRPGQIVFCRIDLAMGTDVTVPLSAEVFLQMGAERIFDANRVALINDHFVPAKDVKAAQLSKTMREFAIKHGVAHYFEVGRSGICHTIVPDSGLVVPGDVVVGADSHTCTYGALGAFATGVGSTDLAAAWALGEIWLRVPETIRVNFTGSLAKHVGAKDMILAVISELGVDGARYQALEFGGPALETMDMAGRFTIANMAIEAGAKCGVMTADEVVLNYLSGRTKRSFEKLEPDLDADYVSVLNLNVSDLEPLVAEPYLPENVKPARACRDIKIDQVVIGSCTNGRLEDFRVAVEYLKGRKVHPRVRLIALPGSQEVIL